MVLPISLTSKEPSMDCPFSTCECGFVFFAMFKAGVPCGNDVEWRAWRCLSLALLKQVSIRVNTKRTFHHHASVVTRTCGIFHSERKTPGLLLFKLTRDIPRDSPGAVLLSIQSGYAVGLTLFRSLCSAFAHGLCSDLPCLQLCLVAGFL